MSHYFFIQSQEPFTDVRAEKHFDLAGQLLAAGHKVTVLLVQNAVLLARQGSRNSAFDTLQRQGVALKADDFSLRQREISPEQLKPGITPAAINSAIDALLAGDKVIWN